MNTRQTTNKIEPANLAPGSVIAVRYPMYKHFAIVSDQGCDVNGTRLPNLISLSYRTGTVQEESWQAVTGEKLVEESHISGSESSHSVLSRARKCMHMELKYKLLTFNCEHFVRYAHGLPIESIQVKKTLYGAALGAATCLLLPNATVMRFTLLAATGAATSLRKSLDKL